MSSKTMATLRETVLEMQKPEWKHVVTKTYQQNAPSGGLAESAGSVFDGRGERKLEPLASSEAPCGQQVIGAARH